MNKRALKYALITITLLLSASALICQTTIPEILQKGRLNEQFDYLEERTRIYENYRAIREDMFQLVKKNSSDSLATARKSINSYIIQARDLNSQIDSLDKLLASTRDELNEAVRTKNSIKLLGINVNKHSYNTIMWIITFWLSSGIRFYCSGKHICHFKKELEDVKTV